MICESGTIGPIEWAIASRPTADEWESGDLAVIEAHHQGVLVAVIDALGHGPGAAATARVIGTTLRAHPEEGLAALLQRCDDACRGGRGAVMSAALLDAASRTLSWTGLGNVEGVLVRAGSAPPKESLLLHGGVLGGRAPAPRVATLELCRGDLLLFSTDGIRPGFADSLMLGWDVDRLARMIHDGHARTDDDSLIVVIRWVGGRP